MSEAIDYTKMPGKITMQSLRARQVQHADARPCLKERILKSLANSFNTFTLLFCQRAKCDNSTCKYYGHIINNKTWSGAFPKCADCGIEINDPKMLRASFVKPAQGEENGEWRRYIDGRLVRSAGLL